MQAQESDLTEVTSDKQKQGVSVMSKTEVSVNPDSAIANSPGVRSVGWASVELFDGVAKGDLRTTPSPQLQDSGPYSYLLFLDPPFLLLPGLKLFFGLICPPFTYGVQNPLPAAVGSALSSDGISTDNAGGWTPSRRIHGHLCYLPFFTEEEPTLTKSSFSSESHRKDHKGDHITCHRSFAFIYLYLFFYALHLETSEAFRASCVLPMLRDNGGAPKTFACLEAHAAQPASRAKPNHYSQETHGRDVLEANVPPRKPSVTEPTSSALQDTTPASLPNSTPATTKITAQPPLEQLSKMEKIRLRTGGKEERRKGKEWKRLRERFAKESCGGEKFPVGVSDPPGLHLLVEEVGFLDIKVSRQSKKATSGSNRCFDHDSLLPVRACHAQQQGFRKVARGRKIGIQSRGSGRMVEESMGSLGIDSRCLDIRVTAGREEERSTTKLLATSWKEKDKTTFRTFLLVQNSNSERKTRSFLSESTGSRVYGCVALIQLEVGNQSRHDR
ncbi:UNVERIFIED_CONTAM: hypothetical protein Scaly_2653300 [Sesamum calycinum]|uniref:Uncharacterized protein n=1 Tax=Sesamum calycinum TaxID=2727403 RepID=A0AAW2J984_9LAMI